MNWRLLSFSTVSVSILVFLISVDTCSWLWSWCWQGGVSYLQPTWDQLVPLARLLTGFQVRFRVILLK